MGLYDEVGVPATEMRLPGEDGLPMAEEIARWNEVGPRYGLEVVGPPHPGVARDTGLPRSTIRRRARRYRRAMPGTGRALLATRPDRRVRGGAHRSRRPPARTGRTHHPPPHRGPCSRR